MKNVDYYFTICKSDETYKCKKCGHGILIIRLSSATSFKSLFTIISTPFLNSFFFIKSIN